MGVATAETFFAPAGRDSRETLYRLNLTINSNQLFRAFVETVPLLCLVLTDKRQIVGINSRVVHTVGVDFSDILGKRPGELMCCEYAAEGPDGCGTGVHCQACGAVRTFLKAQESNQQSTGECSLRLASGDCLEVRITCSPICVDTHRFLSVFLEDISDKKRRQVLEHTFFHDVINTVGGIAGFSSFLKEQCEDPNCGENAALIERLAGSLLEEIEYHRDLMYAESGDLVVDREKVDVESMLKRLVKLYSTHEVADGRRIALDNRVQGFVVTDERLLGRVLGNMIKNALEASERGGTVTVAAAKKPDGTEFAVHNETAMPEEVKLQIFQRSFSTKGSKGRGIGTHSMKLLGEKYLSGKVSFVSDESRGTTFTILLP